VNRRKGEVFVWPLCTRIIHWIIAFSFTAAFITSYTEQYLHYHVAFGWIFGVMLGYRILWGFVGPRYATFNTFKFNLRALLWYFQEKVVNRWRKIPPGHNPASSWYTVLVLFFGSIIVISGLLLYGIQEGKGIFGFLNAEYYSSMILLNDIHTYISYFLAGWVVIHITGVLIEQFYHRTGMVFAMLTGYKKSEGEDTDISPFSLHVSYAFIMLSVIAFYYIVSTYDNFFTRSSYAFIDYKQEHQAYATDCGDCHKVYPPFILPRRSWERIMDNLDNHFGEKITDQNISRSAQNSIRNFLYENCAEHSTREVAYKMCTSIGRRGPKSTSKAPYWRAVHAGIDPAVFKRKSVKDKSNCAACHKDFEHGVLDDINIAIPH
jgi:cytochrome b